MDLMIILFVLIFNVASIAVSKPRSIQNLAHRSTLPESEPYNPSISSAGTEPIRQHLLAEDLDLPNTEHEFHGTSDYEKFVALCEAGFISGCRAAVGAN
jgi:hypothetical protein